MGVNLLGLLRPELLVPGVLDELERRLRAGAPCVVRDAFRHEVAERLHRVLAAADQWQPRVSFERFSGYRNQMIEAAQLPGELRELERAFAEEGSRALISRWTGEDCQEAIDFNAAHYRAGDYSLPHNDFGDGRVVSYICYFTRDWDPRWGGHFCWCAPTATVSPSFNTLVLFRVTPHSHHFVTPVVPQAAGARLTLHGWYRGPQAASDQTRRSDWARGPLDDLGAGVFSIG